MQKSNIRISNSHPKNVNCIKNHTKDDIDFLDKSGIYKLSRNDCNEAYLGKIVRKLETIASANTLNTLISRFLAIIF